MDYEKDQLFRSLQWTVIGTCIANVIFIVLAYVRQFELMAPVQHLYFILAIIFFLIGAIGAFLRSISILVVDAIGLALLLLFSLLLPFKSYSWIVHLVCIFLVLLFAYVCRRRQHREQEPAEP